MKAMKKLFALLLALSLVLSLSVTAFAAGTTEVNMTNSNGHTYEGYKIMDATPNVVTGADGSSTIAGYGYTLIPKYRALLCQVLNSLDPTLNLHYNPELGSGDASNSEESDIIDAYRAVGGNNSDPAKARRLADALYAAIVEANESVKEGDAKPYSPDKTWTIADENTKVILDHGFWLIADVTDLDGKSDANSLVITDTFGTDTATIRGKLGTTTVDKGVDDENDSLVASFAENQDGLAYEDVADYDIGDNVPFQIYGTMSSIIENYNYYSFRLVDEACEDLVFNEDTFRLQMGTAMFATKPAEGEMLMAKVGTDAAANAEFVYTIVKSGTAEHPTNTLTIYPNYGYTLNKLDAQGNPVTKDASAENGGDLYKVGINTNGTALGPKNGMAYNFTYTAKLSESAAAKANKEMGHENKAKLILSNNAYDDTFGETPEVINIVLTYDFIFNKTTEDNRPLTGADFKLEKFIAVKYDYTGTEKPTDNAQATYWHQTAQAWGYWTEIGAQGSTGVKTRYDVNGNPVTDDTATEENEALKATKFVFSGLDDGFYRFTETQTPPGYNAIDPIEFRIVADHVVNINAGTNYDDGFIISLESRGAGENRDIKDDENTPGVLDGVLEASIVNKTGAELPSTGGVGTTMLYVFGSIMMIGAAILLITKRRVGEN